MNKQLKGLITVICRTEQEENPKISINLDLSNFEGFSNESSDLLIEKSKCGRRFVK